MGYDLEVSKVSKSILEEFIECNPGVALRDLWGNAIFTYREHIYDSRCSMFDEFFTSLTCETMSTPVHKGGLDVDIVVDVCTEEGCIFAMLNKNGVSRFLEWIERKLRSMVIYDFIECVDDALEIPEMLSIYKSIRDASIDFDREVIIYSGDW